MPEDPIAILSETVARVENLLRTWEPANAHVVDEKVRRLIDSSRQRLEPLELPGWDFSEGFVLAAGGLVWRSIQPQRLLAVIHRNRYDDWSLPKGKLKPEEPVSLAAVREVWEETGCQPVLTSFAGLLHYPAKRRPKLVFFWHMEAMDAGEFEPSSEVDQVDWLSVSEARARLTYDVERDLVARCSGE